ncbi:MAG TPA: phenylalanine--tRNA ligase subunit beta, partial [Verrucomicrobiae bacterium]|nr:phenylalanine--tRNA ligase subunit beta [Verrucomicrobiae bacterium]
MKTTFNWLKEYVDFDWTAEELAERLTMLGIEVEGVQSLGGEFEGVVVAQVITRDKHPNADKLSLCRVKDGKGERQIVCGAQNFKAGDKVPLILPGHSLPAKPGEAPFTIKVGKIRGMESQGMMCSPQELGLPDAVDGLLILREDARVGQPFAEYLGRSKGDVVYDLEITPNRPDLNSVVGVAREISALTGNPLRLPAIPLPSTAGQPSVGELVSVRVEDAALCPRYTARVIRGVKVGPSPAWLKSAVEKAGIRSISNVVDATNFVMLEIGQPLHAFDYRLLGKNTDGIPSIVVRRAAKDEKFTTLDGQTRSLTDEMLLIADETRAIALAGVMGGQNTEINSATTDVLIESACFEPRNIRATSKKLDLRTDSSYRFERGADVEICDWASRRVAAIILETAGGALAEGMLDVYPAHYEPKQIRLRHERTAAVLGVEIAPARQTAFLQRLGIEAVSNPASGAGSTIFRVPSFRVDIKQEIDLVEEIARLYGVDRIPATPPRGAVGANPFDATHDQLAAIRHLITGLGLTEAQGQTLISEADAKLTGAGPLVPLAHPLSSDMNVLRPSLLPGLLTALRHNLSHRNNDVALFELGRVFLGAASATGSQSKGASAGGITEERRLAFALTGKRNPLFWSGADRDALFDIYDLKGILEEFFEHFGVRGVTFQTHSDPSGFYLESANVALGKLRLGELGVLNPALARRYDLRDPVLLAELNVDMVLGRRNASKSFKPVPALPSVRRDVAMVVPEATTHDAVLAVVKQAKPANLESVELFDVFRGKNVPSGSKSLAYAFTYRGG